MVTDSPPLWQSKGTSKQYIIKTLQLGISHETSDSFSGDRAVIVCLLETALVDSLPSPLPASLPRLDPLPTSLPKGQPSSDLPYAILQHPTCPEKGAGLLATRPIEAGELIAREHPAVILPSNPFPDECYNALASALGGAGENGEGERRRKDLLGMANCRVGPQDHVTKVEGIVRTNALVLELNTKSKSIWNESDTQKQDIYGGLYPLINRCNHSCGPNAAVKWDLSSLSLSLYALRDISIGEEIVKSYVNPVLPRSTRMDVLRRNYRFECDCPWCEVKGSTADDSGKENIPPKSTKALIADSDARRESLASWVFTHPNFRKWSTDLCRPDDWIIKSHLEALKLIRTESLFALQGLFVEELAMAYGVLGDKEKFLEWAVKAIRLSRVEDAQGSRKWENMLQDVEKRFGKVAGVQWGWRKIQKELLSKQHSGLEFEDDDNSLRGMFGAEDSDED